MDRHPSLDLTVATARADAGRRHDELYPRYGVTRVLEQFDPDAVAERADAAMVAYPHKTAAGAVKPLRERGLKVVDLSADFRLDQASYERLYQPHEAPELLGEAVYGLPEAPPRRDRRPAPLVAGPGCNSTAGLLATLPRAAGSKTPCSTSRRACRVPAARPPRRRTTRRPPRT